jgi:polar amino acid transport system substrate-binding protein
MKSRGFHGACLAMLMLASGAQAAPVLHPLSIVSEEWVDYTNADGTGLAWDLLRQVFEPAGYKVSTRAEPYTRAVGLVQRGEADVWVGSYKDEADSLYPRWNFDVDHVYALGLVSRPSPDLNLLGQYKLAWVRGYEYQRYLPNIKHYTEVHRRTGILSMLDLGRADYYIDALSEIQALLRDSPRQSSYKVTHVAELPLYIGFTESPKGQRLRALFDQRMDELVPSGQLRGLFSKWHQPYPFELQTTVKAR